MCGRAERRPWRKKQVPLDCGQGVTTIYRSTNKGRNVEEPKWLSGCSPPIQQLDVGMWRRRRDSNPRDGFPPAPLAGVCLRPLGHVSAGGGIGGRRGKQGGNTGRVHARHGAEIESPVQVQYRPPDPRGHRSVLGRQEVGSCRWIPLRRIGSLRRPGVGTRGGRRGHLD